MYMGNPSLEFAKDKFTKSKFGFDTHVFLSKIRKVMSKALVLSKTGKMDTFKKKKYPAKKTMIVKPRYSYLNQSDLGNRPELKDVNTVSTLAPPLTSSFTAPTLINGIAQGVGNNERVGRKVNIKSISLRYTHSPTSGGPDSQVRIAIVYDKQANGSLPSAVDIFNQSNFLSHLTLANADRFVVIMDEISVSSQSSALNISGSRYTKCNLETIFAGTTSGIASINSGALMILAANNADPTIGAVSTLYYNVRLRYTDV